MYLPIFQESLARISSNELFKENAPTGLSLKKEANETKKTSFAEVKSNMLLRDQEEILNV